MRLPRMLTRPLEQRMVRDAEWRVREELAHLATLQARLERSVASYESNGGLRRKTLASVTFEDLRDLGLSITESTRLLNMRHRGEVATLADLEHVRALSQRSRVTLERELPE